MNLSISLRVVSVSWGTRRYVFRWQLKPEPLQKESYPGIAQLTGLSNFTVAFFARLNIRYDRYDHHNEDL